MLAKKAEKQKSQEKEKKSHHPPSPGPQPLRKTEKACAHMPSRGALDSQETPEERAAALASLEAEPSGE